MERPDSPPREVAGEPQATWRWIVRATILYVFALFGATYPMFLTMGSRVSGETDQFQHIAIMRANRAAILGGHPAPILPGMQYPIGAPVGNFSPLHFESLLFVGLDPIFGDAVSYNLIWLFGMVGTGVGTALLAEALLKDRLAATFAGLAAMLSGSMMMHGLGHLELIHMEWFPLFLLAWIRFVDRPGGRRLAVAALMYVLVSMSAAYFAVLTMIPAALYVAWSAARDGFSAPRSWMRTRLPWLLGFVGAAGPALIVVFAGHLWAATHGFSLKRSRASFDASGAPLWGYLTQGFAHRSKALRLFDVFGQADSVLTIENASYLGLVVFSLIVVAALSRAKFRNAGFWWASTILLVLLSCGTSWTIAGRTIPLPAGWLWDYVPIFRMLRTPARFNLLACVSASILAAAGLGVILSKIRSRAARNVAFVAIASLAAFDLSIKLPNTPIDVPPAPKAYAYIRDRDPKATVIDVPHCQSGHPSKVNSAFTYWQTLHHLTTTAGYSGVSNVPYDQLMFIPSPFAYERLCHPDFLAKSCEMNLVTTVGNDYLDYVWLYLSVHRLDYVVVHQAARFHDDGPINLTGLMAVMAGSRVFEDADAAVYDRSKIRAPIRPTILCLDGWRLLNTWGRAAKKVATLAVYNPDPRRELTLVMEASSLRKPRPVVVRSGGTEIARWDVLPDFGGRFESPPFRLPEGVGTITIESDKESMPDGLDLPEISQPYSLRVASIALKAGESIRR